jgi:RNA polymerase sigma-70 factor, ECF subfamily
MLDFSDEELARRAAQGHIACFEEILSRYRDRIYRLCLRWAGNRDDAEDWAQECFVRAYRQLHRYDSNLPFAPWMLRLTTNTCINLAKARSRHQHRETLDDDWQDENSLAHAPLEQQDEARRVRAAVQVLPPPLRAAVVLRFVEELSFREISEVLGVPLQTAVTRCKRAIELTRRNYEREKNQTKNRSRKEALPRKASPRKEGWK